MWCGDLSVCFIFYVLIDKMVRNVGYSCVLIAREEKKLYLTTIALGIVIRPSTQR